MGSSGGVVKADETYIGRKPGMKLKPGTGHKEMYDNSDIGYAGYFHHAASGLDFAMHRAYDPAHARWLNRDPLGERGGLNLYAYVAGNPLRWTDPLGLVCPTPGYDPTTGGLNPQTQAALDTWNEALQDVANDIAAGKSPQADIDRANTAAANYNHYIGQGPYAGPVSPAAPPPPLPPPSLAPVPVHMDF